MAIQSESEWFSFLSQTIFMLLMSEKTRLNPGDGEMWVSFYEGFELQSAEAKKEEDAAGAANACVDQYRVSERAAQLVNLMTKYFATLHAGRPANDDARTKGGV